jgi:acetoacetyl-CoA synthetase
MTNATTVVNSDPLHDAPLWKPSESYIKTTRFKDFEKHIEAAYGVKFSSYDEIWQWSVDNVAVFWDAVWNFCGVIGEKGDIVLENEDQMPGAAFYPHGRLNYAQNMLRRRDDHPAIIFRDEKGRERTITFNGLYDKVSRWSQAFKAQGVGKGDRVAGYMPNMPETIIAMLATASLGAIWSSASPDFGVQGVIDRFGQIEPKILVSVNGYFYGGKTFDCLDKIKQIQPHLKHLKQTVIVTLSDEDSALDDMANTISEDDFIADFAAKDIAFEIVPFNHPLVIMFSSGTTGIPKCIVHGHGGTLLQHMKEHQLQSDIHRDDKVFYFTTCGWMMWNWLVSALASEATVLLYDGSPFYPDGNVLWDYTAAHHCTFFGTSAKYIDALKVAGLSPSRTHDLSAMRTMASTGSPLVHESFDYVYRAIKPDVHLASISGGTDIVSCFVLGNPISPVWRGEIQGAGLGMAVAVFDDNGSPISSGAGSGELVCTKPFPCMPVAFWNDEDGSRYKSAYFENYPNIWCHGDWIERTSHNGLIIHGRSDATLNPGGVRIGTAEIYRQVEQIDNVVESIAVGQDWDGDVRIILFVVLKEGISLDDDLKKQIVTAIRKGASPRHVPAKIIQVSDIPRTKSNKIVELAVRHIIHGRPVKNVEALANPQALALYENLEELQS